jgi:carboxymethylenebutenolidase
MTATELTRRAFAVTTLGAGFALAVRPVAAGTIATPADGLDAGEVKIAVADGAIPGYRARPAGGKNEPVVLVVQEIFGVHEHIKDLCRRLAKLGYYAIAPEMYARQGDPATAPDIQTLVSTIVNKVPDAQVMSDLDRAVAFAGGEGADAAKLAVTGFCWGGRITWLYAAHSTTLKAGVAYYGRLVGETNDLRPKHPVDVAASLKAPVLGLYGGKDEGIPLDTVDAMTAALKAANSPSQIHVYPDAPHGFLADYRPSYTPDVAADAWARMLDWFKSNGVA